MVRWRSERHDRGMSESQQTSIESGPVADTGRGPRVSGEQMRDVSRLRRSRTDRKIAGVAGGLARHLDIDPTLIRVVLVVLALFGGAGVVLYGAAWLLVPDEGQSEGVLGTSTETRTIGLVIALIVAAALLLGDGWWFGGLTFPWPLLVLGLVLYLVLRNRGTSAAATAPTPPTPETPEAAPTGTPPTGTPPTDPSLAPSASTPAPRGPRGPTLLGITTACLLVVLGGLGIYELAIADVPTAAYPAAALTVIGVALLVGAWVGRVGGLIVLGLVATVALVVTAASPTLRFGELEDRPVSAADVEAQYAMTAGRTVLDLSGVEDLEALDGRTIELDNRLGEIVVVVPDGLDVSVDAYARPASSTCSARSATGVASTTRSWPPTTPIQTCRSTSASASATWK